MEEETHWPPIEPTTPAINPYEFIPIPPPPPKKRKIRLIVLLIVLVVLAASIGGAYTAVTSYQQAVQTEKTQNDARGTVSAYTTSTVISQNTSIAATHIAINATSTQMGSDITATAVQHSINATVAASVPTSTPVPSMNTAEELYGQFINASIPMGNAGDIPNSWWTQYFTYYPARGSVQFTDESSYGKMIIALFDTVNGAQTDASEVSGWGTFRVGTCLLLYQSASTNLTPYQQVMQQYCT